MNHQRQYFVYIMANNYHTVLYTGVTNNLARRVYQHRTGRGSWFTSKYQITKLVYYEVTEDALSAIAREKQIKASSRRKKIEMIATLNPGWRDLAADWE